MAIVNPIQTANPGQRPGFVLLIAPARSYRVASYIRAAENRGYRLLIVADSKHSLIPAIASGITVDFRQPDRALAIIKDAIGDQQVVAVIPTDDLVVTLASQVACHLGLPHNDPVSATLTRRKDLARQRLRQHGCNTPEFNVCHFNDIDNCARLQAYPVVLKPLMLSGSRGVIRANDSDEFIAAASLLRDIVRLEPASDYEKSHFLIEEFLAGPEIALDAFVQIGKLELLALFEKPEPLNGPYFEESYYITPTRHERSTIDAITREVARCCTAYGLTHGPVHAEARLTNRGVVLIEMASRTIGGQCAQTLEYVLGSSLEEVVIQMMCQDTVELDRRSSYAGVLMIPITRQGILKRVEGLLQAQQVRHVTQIDIHIQPGYELVPLPRGSSYLGFVFASADNFDDTYQALREAQQALNFITAPSWAIDTS